HDAEYTERQYQKFRTWGHSSYVSALDLAVSAKVKRFGLFHFNQERTDRDVDEMVEDCRKRIAPSGSRLECFGINCGFSIQL
ncbi:MAG: MBL fold metallo-hydrolase, partial [Syntrophaceae bacterium]